MATTYYAINAGGNWTTAATWSTISTKDATRVGDASVAPTSADTCILDDYSGSVTINASTCVCKILDCTSNGNYGGTLAFGTERLSVYGNTTFSSIMTVSGTANSGTLRFLADATLTTNSQIIPRLEAYGNGVDVTLADNCTCNGFWVYQIVNFNGNTIICNGSANFGGAGTSVGGTTSFVMGGTGTLQGSCNLNITINTAGTITFATDTDYFTFASANTPTFTYTAGTVVTTNATFIIYDDCTLNVSGITFNNIYCNKTHATVTLTSHLKCTGTFLVGPAINVVMAGAYDIYCGTLEVYTSGSTATNFSIVAGQSIRVSTALKIFSNNQVISTIKSATTSSSAYLIYHGTLGNCCCVNAAFTDIDASTSGSGAIYNWFGNTLTRTSNIYNIDDADFPLASDVKSGVDYAGGILTGTYGGGGAYTFIS